MSGSTLKHGETRTYINGERVTKGPWRATFDGHGAMSIDNNEGKQVCYVRNESDARLIASAPDLLEAVWGVDVLYAELQAALPGIVNTPAWDIVQNAVKQSRDAIAKATTI